ncbi:MAG TPA: energy transducer TonB [Longimicrobium sp.]|jgi:TonB family protein
MRNASTGILLALALLTGCASSRGARAADSRRGGGDLFRPCPGQDAAMARIAGRPRVPRKDLGPIEIRIARELRPGERPPRSAPRLDLRAELELRVNAEGRVTEVHVLRSTGNFNVDGSITSSARNLRFDPETEWAFPVPGCALFSFHLQS